jgi:glyceraldehyde 3-phosphate dehydrogenase
MTLDTREGSLQRVIRQASSISLLKWSAAAAVGLVLPELSGKLDGAAIRVPTPNVSFIDLKFTAKRATTVEEVNKAIVAATQSNRLSKIIAWTKDPLVSSDLNHDPHSATFGIDQTKVIGGTFVRVVAWYDNEWGFSNRMADTAVAMGKLI